MKINQKTALQKRKKIIKHFKMTVINWAIFSDLIFKYQSAGFLTPLELHMLVLQYNMMFYFPPPCFFLSDSVMNYIGVSRYWVTKVRAQTHFYDSTKILLCLFLENEESFWSCNCFYLHQKTKFLWSLKREITF